jgi:hypothetical protein
LGLSGLRESAIFFSTNSHCARQKGIGRTHYYAQQASGGGPVELRAGPRKVSITRRSAEAWERRFEKQPATTIAAATLHRLATPQAIRSGGLPKTSLLDVFNRFADYNQYNQLRPDRRL